MFARYAKSYVDRLYESKDVSELYNIISVIQKQRQLPEQFSVFVGLWEWVCSQRSGIYQYYECMEHGDRSEFESLADGLARFGFQEIADRYRSGMVGWRDDLCSELDIWMDDHVDELIAAAFKLIAENRICLYGDET